MAIALRPRPSASAISSRYGSQALAVGARPGGDGRRGSVDASAEWAAFGGPESVDTAGVVAGFEGPESVDTSGVVAGFGGHTRGRPPRSRTGIPAAFR